MHPGLKTLFVLEVAVCFGPLILWWGMSLVYLGVQILGLFHKFSVDIVLGFLLTGVMVASGALGLIALLEVVRSIFNPAASLMNSKVAALFMIIGLIPVVWIVSYGEWANWKLIGVVPMIATLHIIYLGRYYLFSGSHKQD